MEKDGNKDSFALDREIAELQGKLTEMKKGYEYTVHQFAKGIINQYINNSYYNHINYNSDIGRSAVNKKEKEAMKKLNFTVNKIITPPESAR